MTSGKRVAHDVEAMVELVIRERRIALPSERLFWYARWFGLDVKRETFDKILHRMVKSGQLVEIQDGRFRYFKNRRS